MGTLFCVQSKWFKVTKNQLKPSFLLFQSCFRDCSASVDFSLAATSCAASAVVAGELTKWMKFKEIFVNYSNIFSAVAVASVHPKSQMTRMKSAQMLETLLGMRKQR